ncbi:hypothetical protein E2562_019354 [Oryza meyeriana var. granulata]|uniref:Uncharacterized protein n=1 Tax=Oryza meyeriana var. granulata TaxID=110450 RepID=A0A6G1BN72_9ORYZ|nr:hypothetical protein E2562_019354 [Oryza meyeriana var. granulata]
MRRAGEDVLRPPRVIVPCPPRSSPSMATLIHAASCSPHARFPHLPGSPANLLLHATSRHPLAPAGPPRLGEDLFSTSPPLLPPWMCNTSSRSTPPSPAHLIDFCFEHHGE